MSNNKQIEKKLKLPHRETVISTNKLQTKPFDNQKIEIMSNNKQTMKLYTEEQVLRMLEVCRDSDLYEHILTFEDILKTETPIELPSDEEVKKQNPFVWGSHVFGTRDLLIWEQGVEWMRDKIQGGKK